MIDTSLAPASRAYARLPLILLPLLSLAVASCGNLPTPPAGDSDGTADRPTDNQIGSGEALVTGVVRAAEGDQPLPVGGARILLGDAAAVSNVDGSFVLFGVPSGRQTFVIDGSALQTGDGHYARIVSQWNVPGDREVVLSRPVYLPFLRSAQLGTVQQDRETIVTAGGGASIRIPPGGARIGNVEYTGEIALLELPAARTPLALPADIESRAGRVLLVHPGELRFATPVAVSLPLAEEEADTERHRSVWSWDRRSASLLHSAVLERRGNRWVTAAGGINGGGVHVVTPSGWTALESCAEAGADGGDPDGCLGRWMDLIEGIQERVPAALPGARTLFAAYTELLQARGSDVNRAGEFLQTAGPLVPNVRDGLRSYDQLYQALEEGTDWAARLGAARSACAEVGGCGDGGSDIESLLEFVDVRLGRVDANARVNASPLHHLSTAMEALLPFHVGSTPLTAEALPVFEAAAREFLAAYGFFEATDGPAAAVDELILLVDEVRSGALSAARTVSTPVLSAEDGSVVRLQELCEGWGTVRISAPQGADGFIPWEVAGAEQAGACLYVAVDALARRTAAPRSVEDGSASPRPPAWIALDRELVLRSVQVGALTSDVLTAESPVHVWAFDAPQRSGVNVIFDAAGGAVAGVGSADGVLYAAGRGGMRVSNLPGDAGTALYVLSTFAGDANDDAYGFSAEPSGELFDFGVPVHGRFDVIYRAHAILMQGEAGERVFVERRCCASSAGDWSYRVFDAAGEELTPLEAGPSAPGSGSALFEFHSSGVHRVVAVPQPGTFPEYELALHRVSEPIPVPYSLGTSVTAALDAYGQTAVYSFDALAGDELVIEGIAATGMERVRVDVIGPLEEVLLSGVHLYFDGSSFARRTFRPISTGLHTISLRASVDGETLTGTVTFVIRPAGAAGESPQ
jgi:hypothetical protein